LAGWASKKVVPCVTDRFKAMYTAMFRGEVETIFDFGQFRMLLIKIPDLFYR